MLLLLANLSKAIAPPATIPQAPSTFTQTTQVKVNSKNSEKSCYKSPPIVPNGMRLKAVTIKIAAIHDVGIKAKPGSKTRTRSIVINEEIN